MTGLKRLIMPGTSCGSVLLAVTTSVFPLQEVTVAIPKAALRIKENTAAPGIPLPSLPTTVASGRFS